VVRETVIFARSRGLHVVLVSIPRSAGKIRRDRRPDGTLNVLLARIDMNTRNAKPGAWALALVAAGVMSACGGGGGGGGAPGTTPESTTTTSVSTTSTTLDGVAQPYTVTFRLDDAVTVAGLQLEVHYGAARGEFLGRGQNVSCSSPLSANGAIVVFNDVDATEQLNFAVLALGGFTGPTVVARCTFVASGPAPVPGDFAMTVVDAHAPGSAPIEPPPRVRVSSVAAE
jgi:hypothetical protein